MDEDKPRFKPIRTEDVPENIRLVDSLFVGDRPLSCSEEILAKLRGFVTNKPPGQIYAVNRSGRYWVAHQPSTGASNVVV